MKILIDMNLSPERHEILAGTTGKKVGSHRTRATQSS